MNKKKELSAKTETTENHEQIPEDGSSIGSSLRIPDRKLLAEIRRLASLKGRSPTMREMESEGKYSASTYKTHFETWSNALSKVGLEVHQSTPSVSVTKQDIREAIRDLADQLDRVPTATEMEAHGRHSPKTAQRRFGTWNEALRAAGLEPNLEMNLSKERLLEEIRRLANELGHPPSTNDLKRDGQLSHRAYFRQFEDWHSAIRAAGYEPRGWPSGPENPKWRGGKIEQYYGSDWDSQRLRALQRDQFRCQMPGCEITRESHCEQFGMDLNVHHIIPARNFLQAEEPDYQAMNKLANLVTLCVRHHCYWEQLSPLQPDIRE